VEGHQSSQHRSGARPHEYENEYEDDGYADEYEGDIEGVPDAIDAEYADGDDDTYAEPDDWDDQPVGTRVRSTRRFPAVEDPDGRPQPRGRIRHLRGRPPLAARISVAVVACVVIAGLIGATVYRLHLGMQPIVAKTHTAAPQTPPVITLLSPNSSGATPGTGATGTVAPLPVVTSPAPSQYLAPDKPSAYELSLIAASGAPEKAIVVSRDSQTIHVYQNGQFIAGSYAITGRPQLPTPVGVYQIFMKEGPVTLYSPWPPGSPFYYTPEPVNYVMEFRAGGFLIHDAPWHHVWGPGMNDWHYDPVANEWQWGTHGCVTAPSPFIQWLYNWSPYGTTVIVY
jgi:lipoprotein-anchoring transpeptidase ErfK/SrfK